MFVIDVDEEVSLFARLKLLERQNEQALIEILVAEMRVPVEAMLAIDDPGGPIAIRKRQPAERDVRVARALVDAFLEAGPVCEVEKNVGWEVSALLSGSRKKDRPPVESKDQRL